MNKPILIGILILISTFQVFAEEQFASQVVKYSSQAGNKGYAAKQVLGIPNALDYGRNPVAWAPEAANLGTEYIEVGFARPMRIQQIAVWENFNPGAVFQIYLIDKSGKSHKVYEQQKPEKQVPRTRIFRYMMKMTSYEVSGVKLILNTAEVYGLNQIDAIGISSTTEPMQSIIRNPTDQAFLGKPENLGPRVNSVDPDLLPFISVDGQTIYFARKNHANNIGDNKNDDIYTAHKEKNGEWSEAYNIGPPLNNPFNNFVCAVNPDGTEVLLSGRYTVNGLTKEGLHRTTYSNGIWSAPTPIIIENYKNSSPFVCYHISPDMKFLVIAMEHPDTYGDMDIYVSQRKSEGRYSTPKNLGPVINSAGTEPSVFLSADGKTIYFASDGHPGYGAYDMYMSRRLDNSWTNWSEPVNLGPGINTSDWDLYYTVPASGEYAYYSSEHNSIGRSDLYRVKLPKDVRPEPVAIVKPNFINLKTNAPISKLEKENKSIVLQGDSKVNLYEEVKGYYPVNTSRDLSEVLEEEDDFGSGGKKKNENKVDEQLESQMEDLLARLQELKNEQASADNQFEEMSRTPEPASGTQTTKVNQPIVPGNDLDDQLAALRSDMDRINKGKKPDNNYETDRDTKSYSITPTESPTVVSTKTPTADSRDYTPTYYSNYNENVAPEEHLNYRDAIAELKASKDKVASSPQPLTKYALQRTGIDDETHEELVASTLKTELDSVRNQQEKTDTLNPEVEAYRQKLESLKEDKEPVGLPTGGGRITTPTSTSTESPVETDPEVIAFQQKLEEMKQKMDQFPEISSADDIAEVTQFPVESMDEIPVPEQSKGKSRKATRENKRDEISEEPDLLAEVDSKEREEVDKKAVQEPDIAEEVDPEVLAMQQKLEDMKHKMEKYPTNSFRTEEADDVESLTNAVEETPAPGESDLTAIKTDKKPVQDEKSVEEIVTEVRISPDEGTTSLLATVQMTEPVIKDVEVSENQAVDSLAIVLKQKEEAESAKEEAVAEMQQIEAEKEEMVRQKKELENILAELEEERAQFMREQKKLENERKQLEDMRLQQHLQVKELESEIAALQKQKSKSQPVAQAETKADAAGTSAAMDEQIFLMPLEVGVTVEIRNVFFSANSAYIKPQSYPEIDKVAAFLKVNSTISVEIGGHTNGICQESFCNTLSLRRATSVRDYLVSSGIDNTRLNAKGYGKANPLADNSTLEGRKKNQRVELKILKVE